MIFILLIVVALVLFLILKPKKEVKAEPPIQKPKYSYEITYLKECQNVERFVKAYKDDFDENDDYSLSAKELKEDYAGERVYKYEPYELPYKLDGNIVYSQIGDEWLEVGKLKKGVKLDDFATFYLYPNEYKYVTEDSVEKENDGAYFGFYYKKPLEEKSSQ